jgi:hypothetical protein
MKKLFLLFSLLLFSGNLFLINAQLTGIKTIPGDYPSIAAAIAALNTNGVGSGGVTFSIAAGYTETASNLAIAITTNQPTASNPVVFQKSGTGANPLITAAPGISQNLDGIIKLSGTDYITFESINLLDPSTNTGDAMMEWGFALLRASTTDGCQNVVIKNCSITLQKINVISSTVFSIGIYVANRDLTGATVNATDAAGQNSYNRFYGNNISNVYRGMQIISASSPIVAKDVDNRIGVAGQSPNSITNWGGGNQTAEGIRCEGQVNVKISNNIINGGIGSTTFIYGIIATLFGATGSAPNYEISNNTVTIEGGTSNLQYAIRALATGDTVRIFNNIVENCTTASSTAGYFAIAHDPTGTTNAAYIHNNIVRNNIHSGTGAATLLAATGTINYLEMNNNEVYGNRKSGASGLMYCIRTENGNINCYSNEVYDNSIPSSSGSSAASVYGYYNSGSTATSENIFDNSIRNLSVGGSTSSTSSVTYGIYCVPGLSSSTVVKNIYGNIIRGLSHTIGTVGGIFQQYGATAQIHGNNISNLTTGSSNTTNYAAGIIVAGVLTGPGTASTVYNNFISDIKAPNSPHSNGVIGINSTLSAAGTSVSLYYNSIYLNSASSGANFGSSGISSVGNATPTTAALEMKNNIVINRSTPNGSGLTVVFRRTNENLANYSLNSNNNDFFAGTPSSNRLIYYDGTNSDQTLADYKLRVAPRDANSISKMVHFVDVFSGDLHLADSSWADFDLAGIPISAITTDIDGDLRDLIYPYMGGDEAPVPIPVELTSFTASVSGIVVLLNWTTATETNNSGFAIERKSILNSKSEFQNSNWEEIGFVPGYGTSTEPRIYSYTDAGLSSGIYFYRIKQIDYNGTFTYYELGSSVEISTPEVFGLEQNYPNPFNPATKIEYSVAEATDVRLVIYNSIGQEVAVLVNEMQQPGRYTVGFDASTLSSGVYFYKITAGNFISVKKMMIMK